MDFQNFVDSFAISACVMSVERTPDGHCGDIRVVSANKLYKEHMGESTYYDGIIYSELVPKEPQFEEFCFRCAFQKRRLRSYVEMKTFDCWTDSAYIPLESDKENIGYCAFFFEFTQNADSDRLASVSFETASSVIKTCTELRKSDDFKSCLNAVMSEIQEKSDCFCSTIILIDREKQKYEVLCEKFRNDEATMADFEDGLTYEIVSSWESTIAESNGLIIKDEDGMKELAKRNAPWVKTMREAEVKSLILYPIMQGIKTIGFLFITNFDTNRFIEIKELVELTAFFLSSEITNHRLLNKLEFMSTVDLLTGVKNRNAMNRRVDLFVSNEEKVKAPFGILFADLNGLKTMNDQNGHEAGDKLLKNGAKLLTEVFGYDEIYRAGGDEFVVICPGCKKSDFEKKVAELRSKSGYGSNVCFAIGAHWNEDGKNLRLSMHLADEAMYQDKEDFYKEHSDKKRRS